MADVMRLALIILSFALSSPVSASEINLQCFGKFWSYGRETLQGNVENERVTVNLSTMTVFGLYPDTYPITRIDDQTVVFSMEVTGADGARAFALGNIDRITGKTTVFTRRYDKPGQAVFFYDLICRPARRLF
jgi:hypothetical protein